MRRPVFLLLVAFSCGVAAGQTVASIKPCRQDEAIARKAANQPPSPERLRLSCQTVRSLVQWAYLNFADDRFNPLASSPVTGGPPWIDSDLYQIDAVAEKPQTQGTINGAMLRALLEDRFKLKTHRETREVLVYALTVAKGRAKLRTAKEGSCILVDADHPPPPVEPGKPFPKLCGIARLTNSGFDVDGSTIASLCRNLSDSVDRKIVDRTGIKGTFDIHLDLSPADLGHLSRGSVDAAPDPTDVIRTAVRKLGLRLESARAPGEFLVVDSVDKPSEN